MSHSSLLYGVATFIRQKYTYNNLPINETVCDVMPDGRPPPVFGELFISVHPGGSRGNSQEVLWSIHAINVTVTLRTGKSTNDRVGTHDMIKKSLGILEITTKLTKMIHMNYQILQIANSYIDDPANKWAEPLRFNTSPSPRMVGKEWLQVEEGTDLAIVHNINFSEAVLVEFADYQPGIDIKDYEPDVDLIVGTPEIDGGPKYTWQEDLNIPELPDY
jgi:hypothetical protein